MDKNGKKSWNQNNRSQKTLSLTISKDEVKTNFDNEEIVYNDDYNNTRNIYKRGVKAKILRIKDDDTSVCSSEIDVLANVKINKKIKINEKKNKAISSIKDFNKSNCKGRFVNSYKILIKNDKELCEVVLNNTKIVRNSLDKYRINNSDKKRHNYIKRHYPSDSFSGKIY